MKSYTCAVPEMIKIRKTMDGQNRPLTLEVVKECMEDDCPFAAFPVVGDCLEAAGVDDGDWLGVDFSHFPAPPRYKSEGGDGSYDLCLCYVRWPGMDMPTVMSKVYDGVWGGRQMVSTHYDMWKNGGFRLNVSLFAEEIFGVVFAAWDKEGKLKWSRDLKDFPEKLGTVSTIHGVNVSDPISFERGRGYESSF